MKFWIGLLLRVVLVGGGGGVVGAALGYLGARLAL